MCPGHFDIRPSQMSDLTKCRLFVRFDFQKAFDEKLPRQDGSLLQTLSISVPGGMCMPDSYLSTCRQLADHFISTGKLNQTEAEQRLSQVAERMADLRRLATKRIETAGLHNASVLTSGHQAGFCRWLGLHVAAAFSGPDTAGIREIEQVAAAGEKDGVRMIIANEPEGRRLADALADRLQAKVVVFANFPEPEKERAFDDMIRRNLKALTDAVQPSLEKQ
jgi:zinc transport system substrate-binding protein